MKVWILEVGAYEDKEIRGVFASSESARKSYSPTLPEAIHRDVDPFTKLPYLYQWSEVDEDGECYFYGGIMSCARITKHEVQP